LKIRVIPVSEQKVKTKKSYKVEGDRSRMDFLREEIHQGNTKLEKKEFLPT